MSDKFIACIEEEIAQAQDCPEDTEKPTKKRKVASGAKPVFVVPVETESKDKKDVSRVFSTKAQAIKAFEIVQQDLKHSQQQNSDLRAQLTAACEKIAELESKLQLEHDKKDAMMAMMLQKTETQRNMLWTQSAKVTDQAMNALTGHRKEETNMASSSTSTILRKLFEIHRECQIYLPPLPTPEEVQKPEVQTAFRGELHRRLTQFASKDEKIAFANQLSSVLTKAEAEWRQEKQHCLDHVITDNGVEYQQRCTQLAISGLYLAKDTLDKLFLKEKEKEKEKDGQLGKIVKKEN
jgi:hypothetical protein